MRAWHVSCREYSAWAFPVGAQQQGWVPYTRGQGVLSPVCVCVLFVECEGVLRAFQMCDPLSRTPVRSSAASDLPFLKN